MLHTCISWIWTCISFHDKNRCIFLRLSSLICSCLSGSCKSNSSPSSRKCQWSDRLKLHAVWWWLFLDDASQNGSGSNLAGCRTDECSVFIAKPHVCELNGTEDVWGSIFMKWRACRDTTLGLRRKMNQKQFVDLSIPVALPGCMRGHCLRRRREAQRLAAKMFWRCWCRTGFVSFWPMMTCKPAE